MTVKNKERELKDGLYEEVHKAVVRTPKKPLPTLEEVFQKALDEVNPNDKRISATPDWVNDLGGSS